MPERRKFAEPQWTFGFTLATAGVAVEPWLISLLTCPVDHAPVRGVGTELVCDRCERRYSVHDRIPVMFPAEPESEHKF